MTPAKFTSDPTFAERMRKEEEFFNRPVDQPFKLSYSGLNKLIYSPGLFYNHYVLGQREDVNEKYMIEGRLVHCLLLKPECFNDEFILNSYEMPTDSHKKVLDRLFTHYTCLTEDDVLFGKVTLEDFSNAILDILTDENLFQSLKTDAQRLEKIITPKNAMYWHFLKSSPGKTIIDQEQYDYANKMVAKITSNSSILELMGFFADSMSNISKWNEVMAEVDAPGITSFKLRGILDNLVIDHEKKEIRVNDLKKTSKSLSTFEESIDHYNYWMQAAMYVKLAKVISTYDSYPVIFRFIVIDPYMQLSTIRISDETMAVWTEKLDQKIKEADYHFKTRNFDLPYSHIINGELVL